MRGIYVLLYLIISIMSQSQFPLTIIPNQDGSYTVTSPMFNIITEGDSLEEAIKNGKEAIECHIEGYQLHPDENYPLMKSSRQNAFTTFVPVQYA